MYLKLVTPPTELPLTLEEVKVHLRVDHSAEDALITGLISAATNHVQNITNRQLMRATYRLSLDRLPSSFPLPRPPYAAITSITAIDEAEQVVEFEETFYRVDELDHATIYGLKESGWYASTYKDIVVEYQAGYATAADVPADIKVAMLLIIGHLYENREDKSDRFPKASDALLSSYRVFSF